MKKEKLYYTEIEKIFYKYVFEQLIKESETEIKIVKIINELNFEYIINEIYYDIYKYIDINNKFTRKSFYRKVEKILYKNSQEIYSNILILGEPNIEYYLVEKDFEKTINKIIKKIFKKKKIKKDNSNNIERENILDWFARMNFKYFKYYKKSGTDIDVFSFYLPGSDEKFNSIELYNLYNLDISDDLYNRWLKAINENNDYNKNIKDEIR